MTTITQYRITGTEDGQKWSTRWHDSRAEALATKWAGKEGATLDSREYTAGAQPLKAQPAAQIVECSRHEICAMAREAMKRGAAFGAQPIGPALYRVMVMENTKNTLTA